VDGRLVDLGIAEDTLNGFHSGTEKILAKLFETSTGDAGVEVDTLKQRVDLDGSLSGGREGTLGALASGSETAEGTSVGGEILLVLSFEFVCEVVNETVVEVFASQMGVTGGGLDLEDTLFNGEEGDIESTTTKIEDQDIALASGLLVESISDGCSGGLVDDTEDVKACD
jgi:hypothetical protein